MDYVKFNNKIYKKIDGFLNYYISSKGEIISIKRKEWRILKPQIQKKTGYLRIDLCNGKTFTKSVHRLVLETWSPREDMGKLQVDHLDNNKLNNDLENLEWVTASENTKRAWKDGLCKPYYHWKNTPTKDMPRAKKIKQICLDTGDVIKIWDSIKEAEAKYGKSHISCCCRGKRNKSKGYRWEYV